MREALRAHTPALAAATAMLIVAGGLATALPADSVGGSVFAFPVDPIPLPSAAEDVDGDSYRNGKDRFVGDWKVQIIVEGLRLSNPDGLPYLVVGTQDDHWRFGKGAALEWPHIVDADPLGHKPGSAAWRDDVFRTGAWWYSEPLPGASKAIANHGRLSGDDADANFPQEFWVNVRDDRAVVNVTLELHDAKPDPDRRDGLWTVRLDLVHETASIEGVEANFGERMTLGDTPGLDVRVTAGLGIDQVSQRAIAERFAPRLHFAADERFYPTKGEVMAQFHGFSPKTPNYQTWTRDFTNGRDAYVLLLADFNGDRRVDHEDAALMTDILRAGGTAPPAIYWKADVTTNGAIVLQYWFLYVYNFVRDESGEDIAVLAHNGDREFIQLRFASLDDALGGMPESISYSQHYKGIRIPNLEIGKAPFPRDTHPDVYVSRGSHASYPVPGDDSRLRPAFAGFGDLFPGDGEVWSFGNYTLEPLEPASWHLGHRWGPFTRYSRELGTGLKPLLQHSFTYPYLDPVTWQHRLAVLESEDLEAAYGSPP